MPGKKQRSEVEIPILNESQEFSSGVELGILLAQMNDDRVDSIERILPLSIQCQVTLIASRLDWHIRRMHDNPQFGVFYLRMRRKR